MFYDVIVLGVGAMGSAACYALAKRGVNVLGIEQFTLGNRFGSSHGKTRLIRKAYFEHPDYVPLCERSFELWDEICDEAGRGLLHRNGLVTFGPNPEAGVLKGVRESARLYGVEIENYAATQAKDRFPGITPPEGYHAVFEPGAGYLEVEASVQTMAWLSQNRAAEVNTEETVTSWKVDAGEVEVRTNRGCYRAKRLVVTAGPWSGTILKELGLPLTVRRVPQFWFSFSTPLMAKAPMPCFAFDLPEGFVYGMPPVGGAGLKLASHVPAEVISDPMQVNRDITEDDLKKVERVRSQCFHGLKSQPESYDVCLYTLTPDEHFIVDVHPEHPQVSFAAGFSGHGFKFAPIIGEVLADLALQGKSDEPVGFLKIR